MMSAPTSAAAGPQLPVHLTNLTIGYFLLQVLSTNFVLADKRAAAEYDLNSPQPYAQALTCIWPAGQTWVQWPPNAYVSPEVLDKTANFGQSIRVTIDATVAVPSVTAVKTSRISW
jgi:hypothetical protein